MKGVVARMVKYGGLLTGLIMILAGCSATTGGSSSRDFYENRVFIPRVHVEENTFGVTSGSEYWGCSYDTYYEGYWCPKQ